MKLKVAQFFHHHAVCFGSGSVLGDMIFLESLDFDHHTLIGTLLLTVSMVTTLLVNVPIDNQIKVWTLNSMPSDWSQIRDHWETFHTIRTLIIAGLASI